VLGARAIGGIDWINCRLVIDAQSVQVRVWRFRIRGINGYIVPVYVLDTDVPEDSEWDHHITNSLYGGDSHYRLCPEAGSLLLTNNLNLFPNRSPIISSL
jgi:hypothetical protein